MFVSLPGEISIYEPTLLSKSATGTICLEGGPETEFATTGTRFIPGKEYSTSIGALLGLLRKVYE